MELKKTLGNAGQTEEAFDQAFETAGIDYLD
jgi:hypothetical protein